MREMIGCTPMAHCNNVWGLWVRVIFLWDVLMIFHGFCPLWDLVMRFDAFWPYSHYTRLFLTSRGLGVGGFLFLSTTTPYAVWCFVLHISRMRFRSGMLVLFVGRCELSFFEMSCFLLHNLLMRCHAFGTAAGFAYESSCFVLLMRCPYELSCFLTPRRVACGMSCFLAGKVIMLWGFLYESSSLFAVVRFPCEISCILAAWDHLLRVHDFEMVYEMSLWDVVVVCCIIFSPDEIWRRLQCRFCKRFSFEILYVFCCPIFM